MASPHSTKPFRFLDLPREIRNEIYRLTLCTFQPRSTTSEPPVDAAGNIDLNPNTLTAAKHATNTSILLVSKQIHREAYDTMVKTNRFVRVTSSSGIPLRGLLNHLSVPVVARESKKTNQFNGYTVSVSLTCPKSFIDVLKNTPFNTEPQSLMLLNRDMDIFCESLLEGDILVQGFGTKASIEITVAPDSTLAPLPYKEPMPDFFCETTQEVLLQPFRSGLRGFKNVKVSGLVSPNTAKAAEKDISTDSATDPEAVLARYQAQKDEGQKLYKSGSQDAACLKWDDATVDIERLKLSSSWTTLTGKGGEPFVKRLAEMYFLMKLNAIHVKISNTQKGYPFADMMATDSLTQAKQALSKGFWMPDFTWLPSDVHKAKFLYRQALFSRITNDTKALRQAVAAIDLACRFFPNDPVIVNEREAIMEWMAKVVG